MDAHGTDNRRARREWGDGATRHAGPERIELSYCVVNTSQRELLLRGLDAIAARARGAAVRDRGARARQRLARRLGRGGARAPGGRRDDRAGERARQGAQRLRAAARARAGASRCCSTRTPSCCRAPRSRCGGRCGSDPRAALRRRAAAAPRRHAAGLRVALPRRRWTALAGALFLHRAARPSRAAASAPREVDWCQSAALLVRREAAAQVGYLDPDFFVYSDEVDFARRLRDAGWTQRVRARRRAPSTTSSSRPTPCPSGGSSNWRATATCYMRKHHSAAAALRRALADGAGATRCARSRRSCCPGTRPRATGATSRATLHPGRGEGLREAADGYNRSAET